MLPNRNISIFVNDAHFLSSIWSTVDIDVFFLNCEIQPFVDENLTHVNPLPTLIVRNAKASFQNTTLTSLSVSSKKSCIDTLNSTVIMESCKVQDFKGGSFLQISNGLGKIVDVEFTNCASLSLVNVTNETCLVIEQSTFISNVGHLIYLNKNCLGQISCSVFEYNRGLQNSTLVFGFAGTFLQLENCSFVHNEIQKGTLVGCIGPAIVNIQQSKFVANTVSNMKGIIAISSQGIVTVNGCTFSQNKGTSVLVWNISDVIISNCLFHSNLASYGAGVLLLSDKGKPPAISTADVEKIMHCCTHFRKYMYSGKKALDRGMAPVSGNNSTKIFNCTFIENTAIHGGAIWGRNLPLLLLKCIFVNNSVVKSPSSAGGAVYLLESPANITQCVFDGNVAQGGGGICAKPGSGQTMLVYLCVFTNNLGSSIFLYDGDLINIKHLSQQQFSRQGTNTRQKRTLLVKSSLFLRNTCGAGPGGAIGVDNANIDLIIQGSSFKHNEAVRGGAIFSHNTIITNSDFAFNKAFGYSGGSLYFGYNSHVLLKKSSFVNNTAADGGSIYGEDIVLTCNFCLFENNTADNG